MIHRVAKMCCDNLFDSYGGITHSIDNYMRMLERTGRESLYRLSKGVVETFGDVYMGKPLLHDM